MGSRYSNDWPDIQEWRKMIGIGRPKSTESEFPCWVSLRPEGYVQSLPEAFEYLLQLSLRI